MINLTRIRQLVDQQDGYLADLAAESPELLNGENSALALCIGTNNSILEEINAQKLPTQAYSSTKIQN